MQHILNESTAAMIEGQYQDLTMSLDTSLAAYEAMVARKTGALMMAAAEIGSRIGTPNAARSHPAFRKAGQHLGIAFQMRNDLTGTWQGNDIEKRKITLPVVLAMASPQQESFAGMFARQETTPDDIRGWYEHHDMQQQCEVMLHEHLTVARNLVQEQYSEGVQPLPAMAPVYSLIDQIEGRE